MRRALLWLWICSRAASAGEAILVAEGSQDSLAVRQLRTESLNGVRAAAGYPKAMKTDDLPGLKPGRLVTVVGICPDRKSARRVAAALRGKLSVSVRTVEGEWPSACPSTDPPPAVSPTEARLRKWLEKEPRSQEALYQYAQYLQMAGRLDEAVVQLDKLLALNPDHAHGMELKAVIGVLRTAAP